MLRHAVESELCVQRADTTSDTVEEKSETDLR